MQEEAPTPPPRLIQLFYEANQSQQIPEFRWQEALIVHFKRTPTQNFVYDEFQLTNSELKKSASEISLENSLLVRTLLHNKKLKLDQQSLQNGDTPDTWRKDTDLQLIPIVLFSSPVGALLIPSPIDADAQLIYIFNHQLHLFAGLVRECLFADLREAFAVDRLKSIHDPTVLIESFAEILAKWLNPCDYKIALNGAPPLFQLSWCDVFGQEVYQFQLKFKFITDNLPSEYTITFNIPSTWNPLPGKPDYVHQLPASQMRLLKYEWGLQNFLNTTYNNWKAIQLKKAKELEQALTYRQKKIKKQIAQLKAIRQFLTPTSGLETSSPKTNEFPFCFYRQNGKWIVRFNGETIIFREKSDQGMEAIRILLENEGQFFPPLVLDKALDDAGVNYKKSSRNVIGDMSLDKLNEQELLEEFNTLKREEKIIDKQRFKDQLGYWQYQFNIINALITHSHQRTYIVERSRIKRAIEKLSIHDEFDENFRRLTSQILQPSRKSGNEKNRKDSISAGIKTIIDSLEPFAPIHSYLKQTIVRTNKGAHSPFIYVPDLYSGKGYQKIMWHTLI